MTPRSQTGEPFTVRRVSDANETETFRVDFSRSRCFLKCYGDAALFNKSLRVLTTLADNGFEYSPKILGFSDSAKNADCNCLLMEDLGQSTLLAWPMFTATHGEMLGREVGAALAQLHSLDFDLGNGFEMNVSPSILKSVALVEEGLPHLKTVLSGNGVAGDDPLYARIHWICSAARPLAATKVVIASERRFVHGDCWAPNCVVSVALDVHRFRGFLDFDESGMGSPALDVFRMFTRGVNAHDYVSVTQLLPPIAFWQAFVAGYSTVRTLPELDDDTVLLLLLFYLLRTLLFYMRLLAQDAGLTAPRRRLEKFLAIVECSGNLLETPSLASTLRERYSIMEDSMI